jgi:hypothetical protein
VVHHVRSTGAGPRAARIDSVWDVAPDRAWTRLAVGRAYVARGGESDTLPDAAWAALARAAGRPERDVRDAAFPASAMAIMAAVARPVVWTVAADGAASPRALDVLGGWRVRWAPGDSALLVGGAPARTGDDEPSRAWLRVDARTGRPVGTVPAPPRVAPAAAWEEAPLLDLSTTVDLGASRTLDVAAGRVIGERGAIALVDAGGRRVPLGPGVPLAATADGRVVLALAPRTGRVEDHEVRWRVVLYLVG